MTRGHPFIYTLLWKLMLCYEFPEITVQNLCDRCRRRLILDKYFQRAKFRLFWFQSCWFETNNRVPRDYQNIKRFTYTVTKHIVFLFLISWSWFWMHFINLVVIGKECNWHVSRSFLRSFCATSEDTQCCFERCFISIIFTAITSIPSHYINQTLYKLNSSSW